MRDRLSYLPRDAQLQPVRFDLDFAEVRLREEGGELPDQFLVDACFAHLALLAFLFTRGLAVPFAPRSASGRRGFRCQDGIL